MANTMIPKKLHTIWLGSEPPKSLWSNVKRFLNLNPGWRHTHWDEHGFSVVGLGQRELLEHSEHYSPKSNKYQYQSNLMRLWILREFGGVYLDADMQPLAPLEDTLQPGRFHAAWELQDQWVNNAFLASPPHHPAAVKLTVEVGESITSQPNKRSNHQSGARFITPRLQHRYDVKILPQAWVYPYHWSELHRAGDRFNDALLVHHWNNQRKKQKKPLGV